MLGFSSLASSALADDGAALNIEFAVLDGAIEATPVIGSPSLVERINNALTSANVIAGNPIIGSPLVIPDIKFAVLYDASKPSRIKLESSGKTNARTILDGRLYAKSKLQGKSFVILMGRC